MKLKCDRGFTLVELVIVIAILAIIMMIAVPNVPKILQRQRVKADIITGQKIGQAVRMWYTSQKYDYIAEEPKEGEVSVEAFEDNIPQDNEVTPVKYSDLFMIEEHISSDHMPKSFKPNGNDAKNPYYGVYLSTSGFVAQVVVTIQDDESTTLSFGEGEGKILPDKEAYDGTEAAIVYVE